MTRAELRIGMRIKLARIERHVTQSELAQRSELSQAYLSQIETGDRTPSTVAVEAIVRALGCDLTGEEW
jgi:transcriptional regulator with XRE-family HTH domain